MAHHCIVQMSLSVQLKNQKLRRYSTKRQFQQRPQTDEETSSSVRLPLIKSKRIDVLFCMSQRVWLLHGCRGSPLTLKHRLAVL